MALNSGGAQCCVYSKYMKPATTVIASSARTEPAGIHKGWVGSNRPNTKVFNPVPTSLVLGDSAAGVSSALIHLLIHTSSFTTFAAFDHLSKQQTSRRSHHRR